MFNYQHSSEATSRSDMFLSQQQGSNIQRGPNMQQQTYHHHQYPQWCQNASPQSATSQPRRADLVSISAKPTVISSQSTSNSQQHQRQQNALATVNGDVRGNTEWNKDIDPFNSKDPDSPTLSFSNQIEQLLRYKCNPTLDYGTVDLADNNGNAPGWWTQQQQRSALDTQNTQPSAPPGLGGHPTTSMIRNVPVMRSHQHLTSSQPPSYSSSAIRKPIHREIQPASTTILMSAADLTSHNTYQLTRRRQYHQPNWNSGRQIVTPSQPHSLSNGNRLMVNGSVGTNTGPLVMTQSNGNIQHSTYTLSNDHLHHQQQQQQQQYWLGSPHYFYQQRRSSLSQSTEDLLDPFNGKKKKTVVEQIADRVMKRLLRLVCEEVDESRSKRDASVSTHDLMSTSDFYRNLFNVWKRTWISATDAVDFSAAAFASLCSIESTTTTSSTSD